MMEKTFLIQFVCFVIIAFACLSLGFGSFLETNDLLYSSSPSISQSLSIFKVTMVSSAATKNPDAYLTFGLWRYCISNDNSSTSICSPIKMNFEIGKYTRQRGYYGSEANT